jgi:Fur family ferric uptake transcriptional regulator
MSAFDIRGLLPSGPNIATHGFNVVGSSPFGIARGIIPGSEVSYSHMTILRGSLRKYTLLMSDTPETPRQDLPQLMAPICSVFRRYLKSKGLKYTPERAQILDAIIDRDNVFEVEELLLDMRASNHRVSKATIYRTISLLVEAGIITQALFDSKQAHYRLIYGLEPRDHMVCMRTGRLIEFSNKDITELRDKICRELGWEPTGHRFQIYALSPVQEQEVEISDLQSS